MLAEAIPGWISTDELAAIAAIAHDVQPRVVVEIGSWVGRSAVAWAESLPGATIYCIDPWQLTPNHNLDDASKSVLEDPWLAFLQNTAAFPNIKPIRGWSKVLRYWRGPLVDLVFIDGDHADAFVRHDLMVAREITQEHGVICGHDYANSATQDVKPAVDEFCALYNYRLRTYADFIFRADPL